MNAPQKFGTGAAGFSGLDRIVAELSRLRRSSHRNRYGGGATPQLPSRAAAIEAMDGVVAAMFPRHFGPPGLAGDTLDRFVAFSLTESLKTLLQQVQSELELLGDEAARAGSAERATSITHEFAENVPKIRRMLEADIRAAFDGDPAASSVDEVMCCYPGVYAVIRHRLAHELYGLGSPMLARIIAEAAHSRTGIDIHPGAAIGESFFIDHGTGTVIGETAVVGKRVRLYQGVTLGAKRFEINEDGALAKRYPRHPILEDNVVVYAGASILGRITIGRDSAIGGGVWLTHSVPPCSRITQAEVRNAGFNGGGGI